jgi:hypothetical protein
MHGPLNVKCVTVFKLRTDGKKCVINFVCELHFKVIVVIMKRREWSAATTINSKFRVWSLGGR